MIYQDKYLAKSNKCTAIKLPALMRAKSYMSINAG
jgi:hypothetical protein